LRLRAQAANALSYFVLLKARICWYLVRQWCASALFQFPEGIEVYLPATARGLPPSVEQAGNLNMAAFKRFELHILCPCCGATGDALVSENDDADPVGTVFRVEAYPPGFSGQRHSASQHETLVTCRCGQVFYLL
jgi:hypothetical protein